MFISSGMEACGLAFPSVSFLCPPKPNADKMQDSNCWLEYKNSGKSSEHVVSIFLWTYFLKKESADYDE